MNVGKYSHLRSIFDKVLFCIVTDAATRTVAASIIMRIGEKAFVFKLCHILGHVANARFRTRIWVFLLKRIAVNLYSHRSYFHSIFEQ